MPQSHYLPTSVRTGHTDPSIAHWSIDQPENLVIFVHGFGGSAGGTWPNFPALLSKPDAERAPSDLIFFQYDGRFTQASVSACVFRDFLVSFLANANQFANAALPAGATPRASYTYRKIVVVAHSLGAVVARRALLDAHRQRGIAVPNRWLDAVHLVLYAPAHRGAPLAGLVRALLSSGAWSIPVLGSLARYGCPLIDELTPGSPLLADLEASTLRALHQMGQGPAGFARADKVIWAGRERVVQNLDFADDPPASNEPLHDHMSVCKPASAISPNFQYVSGML